MNFRQSLLAAVACGVALIGGCASAPKPSTTEQTDAAHPVEVEFQPPAGWQILQQEHYDSAEVGTRLRLRLEEWPWVRMDLFAYRVGVTGDLQEGRQSILAQYRAEMDYTVEQGAYESWQVDGQHVLEIDGPALISPGTKLVLRVIKPDHEEGSLTYLFYRPPFALKVRASYPGHVDAKTEAAVDAAVAALIPALKVTAPQACEGRSIELRLPTDLESLGQDEALKQLRVSIAQGTLRHALDGCSDLVEALEKVAEVCAEYEIMCDQPPWRMAGED